MSRQSLRLLITAFAIFVLIGVASLRLLGGSDGNYAHDFYKVLTLFPLNGSWVIQEHVNNPVILVQAFVAPIFAVFGLIELFASDLFRKLARAARLSQLKDHLVLVGLTEESLMLLDALRHENTGLKCVIIDKNIDTEFAQRARKKGAITLPGDPSLPETLARARLPAASQGIFLHAAVTEALQFILASNASLAPDASSKQLIDAKAIDLWVDLKDAAMGVRLGEYFKFTGLSEHLRTQFFSLDELAARQLLRAHPPDVYADAFGQERIHLAVYGLNSVAINVITETLRQCVTLCTSRVKFTILTDEDDDDLAVLYAAFPSINEIADIEFRRLKIFPTGIADADYEAIAENVTLHVVCFDRAEKAASVALSLRRLLLAPPKRFEDAPRRLNAPILVRLGRTSGIGQLLRSNVDRMKVDPTNSLDRNIGEREIPDGIYAFGTLEDLLSADKGRLFIPTLIDNRRENIAKRIHVIYMEERDSVLASEGDAETIRERSRQDWANLAPEFRDSCRQSADHIFTKARVLRLRISRRTRDLETPVDRAIDGDPENIRRLALVEHHRWMNERFLAGWTFDEKRVDAARRHNLLKPWSELPDKDARLDYGVVHRMRDALRAADLDARPSFVIGIVGHRSNTNRPFDSGYIRQALKARMTSEIAARPGCEPMLLTSLAPGTDIIGAEIAFELKIPIVVPLPLPFEALAQDFSDDNRFELDKFLRLIARSERYIELPLRFGDLVEVSRVDRQEEPMARRRQYALAGAYIAERADLLIAVWDGREARGIGGTADVVRWREQGEPPAEYRTAGRYYARAPIAPAVIISPTPSDRSPALVV